jgi:hypothetical protein
VLDNYLLNVARQRDFSNVVDVSAVEPGKCNSDCRVIIMFVGGVYIRNLVLDGKQAPGATPKNQKPFADLGTASPSPFVLIQEDRREVVFLFAFASFREV